MRRGDELQVGKRIREQVGKQPLPGRVQVQTQAVNQQHPAGSQRRFGTRLHGINAQQHIGTPGGHGLVTVRQLPEGNAAVWRLEPCLAPGAVNAVKGDAWQHFVQQLGERRHARSAHAVVQVHGNLFEVRQSSIRRKKRRHGTCPGTHRARFAHLRKRLSGLRRPASSAIGQCEVVAW